MANDNAQTEQEIIAAMRPQIEAMTQALEISLTLSGVDENVALSAVGSVLMNRITRFKVRNAPNVDSQIQKIIDRLAEIRDAAPQAAQAVYAMGSDFASGPPVKAN